MRLKYNKDEMYCLKCHNVYPFPRVTNDFNPPLDNWIFVTIHHTKSSLAKIDSIVTPMICPICKQLISLKELEELINVYGNWRHKTIDNSEFDVLENDTK